MVVVVVVAALLPCTKCFTDQACSAKITRYWCRSFLILRVYGPRIGDWLLYSHLAFLNMIIQCKTKGKLRW